MAAKHHVSVAQLGMRYLLQLGLLPLPKTVNPEHMKANADVNFSIDEADMTPLKQKKPFDRFMVSFKISRIKVILLYLGRTIAW